ncbi:MAG TPA: hypothetical protein VL485_31350 [Ktedonobacteraceae bacterium]|jgi:hypothetical protein|nr:hypothetical protein [Ktedonobacteraceae bacterium]
MAEEHPPAQGRFPGDERIVLPGYTPQGSNLYAEKTEMFGIQPDHKNQYLPSPASDTNSRWRNDPARIALLIAVVLVVLSGGVFTVVATTLFQSSGLQNNDQASAYQTAPPQTPQPQGTVDAHPTFAIPAGTPANTISSLPPQTGTPTLAVPTATSTTQANGSFDLQVVDYPQQANNHSTVQIQVTTGQAHTVVQLSAFYSLSPYFYQGKARTTDDNGNVTLNWPINLDAPVTRHNKGTTTTARFVVRGQNQDGQFATSQNFTVQILLR